jgi:deferrochelatase/peroxidase EfeB
MTMQSMVTISAPVAIGKVEAIRAQIDALLGNPAVGELRAAIEGSGDPFLHFASLHALRGSDGRLGHLVLEFSADGDEAFVIAELARRVGPMFEPIFSQATDWNGARDIGAYWRAHQVHIGYGLFDTVGLAFCGTPRQTVVSIQAECRLANTVSGLLAAQDVAMRPLARLANVRRQLAGSPDFSWALEPAPPPVRTPAGEAGLLTKGLALAGPLIGTLLWPFILVLLPLCIWLAWPGAWAWTQWQGEAAGLAAWLGALKQVAGFLAATIGLLLLFMIGILGGLYLAFARQEARDWLSDRAPDHAELAAMVQHENAPGHSQNHMLSHTVMKPGLIRQLTIRLAFLAVAKLTALNPRAGHLGDIGTIHFARWVTLPGTRDLLFFSNFGGSWESYLEDFINKAHEGLTAVWSNTVGFPRSRNLFLDGATDGERFKRYARASMIHTPFWYSAYPGLTTANIRCNQRIRRGISVAMTEADAVEWLSLFGSVPRPLEKLETTQIQSIVFGGMGFKPDGRLLLVELGDDVGRNRQWLQALLPKIAFNDGRYTATEALLTFATSPSGLRKLGLDASALDTFPAAFLQGMHAQGRDRILGDLDGNHRDHWWWGKDGNDVALLVYGSLARDGEARPIDLLEDAVANLTEAGGGRIVHKVALSPVGPTIADRIEPFGFVDGVSQPAMRGTYRGLRNDDPIHLVEPGEFVLGYPDNHGNVAPGPSMDAALDPRLQLPVAGVAQGFGETVAENPRLIGYNGSFLVIRQLQQHADMFRDYCLKEGERLSGAFPDLPLLTDKESMAEYVGAKMIGRWKDGSSLIRNPYLSASTLKQETGLNATGGTSRPKSQPTDPAAPAIDPSDAVAAPKALPNIRPDNDFLFGTEDPQGVRCPYGAHVRRVNPRESLSPGSNDQIAITNRHRVIRVGRGYLGEDGKTTEGLLFMCLNGDIERQFEFIQQTWMGSTKFHGLTAETDPIAGRGLEGDDGFTIPTRRGPIGLSRLPKFVTMRGGGYFFLPGRQLLRYLSMPDARRGAR